MAIRACIKRCWSRIKIHFTSEKKLVDRELTEALNKEYDARLAFLDEHSDYPIHGTQKDREAYEKRLMGPEYDGCFEIESRFVANPLAVAVAKRFEQAQTESNKASTSTPRSSLNSEQAAKGMVEEDIEFILTLNELVDFADNGKTTPNFENVKNLRGRASSMWL